LRNGYEWSDADTLAVLQKVLSTDTSTCIYRLLQQDVDLLYFVGYVVFRYTNPYVFALRVCVTLEKETVPLFVFAAGLR
jgi:hypothetical protein